MSDLSGWAAERAPHLLARAEEEAIAVLRDALVAAAAPHLGDTLSGPEPARVARREPERATTTPGHLVWAYCVVAAGAELPVEVDGVDASCPLEWVGTPKLAALVSRVPRAEFAADALRENLNDLTWLEGVARAHEAVLEHLLTRTPLVPLRLCTLYEDEDGVRRMLENEERVLTAALASVTGKEEWGLKLIVDSDALMAFARESVSTDSGEPDASEAAAYMTRRRTEREVRSAADAAAAEIVDAVRTQLEAAGIEFVTRPPQNRDLSRHEGEMLLNAACLVDDGGLESLREIAFAVERTYGSLGARAELTGPWPPYNFVVGSDAAALG